MSKQHLNASIKAISSATLACGLTLAATSAQACEVRFGVIGPMTGGASAYGLSTKAGADFIAARTNADGGLQVAGEKCTVKAVSYDAQYTASGGAAAANFMAGENIHAVDGPVGSPETTGFRPVAKRNNILNFSFSYMNGVIGPDYPLSFHATQAPVTWGPIVIKQAQEKFGFHSVMIIAPNDSGGTDASKQLVKLYDAVGVKPTEEYYQRGTTNFDPLAQRVVLANPGSIELSTMPPGDALIFVRQLLEAGYTGVLGSLGGTGSTPIIRGAGGVEKIKAMYWLETISLEDPGILRMKAEYQRVMKAPPPENPLWANSTIAAEQILHAISLAGTDQDGEKIAAAMRGMQVQSAFADKTGWRGKGIYGINQELALPVGLGYIVDGKNLGVQSVEIPTE